MREKPFLCLILDMDGVLWKGDQAIGDLPAIFRDIHAAGLKCIFATNNSTRTREHYVRRLALFGLSATADQILTSAYATGQTLGKRFPDGGPVYAIGEEGLHDALVQNGFFLSPDNPLAVVAGLDRELTYKKLALATHLIRSGLPFYGTNADNTLPTENGLAPGAGSLLAALTSATDVKPTVIGKPAPYLFARAMQLVGINPEQCLVVGDRLETDIQGGNAAGCATALVLSGVTDEVMLARHELKPDYVAPDLHQLIRTFM